MTHEDITIPEDLDDGIPVALEGCPFGNSGSVAGKVGRHRGVTCPLQFDDHRLPAPRTMKAAVDEDESHGKPLLIK